MMFLLYIMVFILFSCISESCLVTIKNGFAELANYPDKLAYLLKFVFILLCLVDILLSSLSVSINFSFDLSFSYSSLSLEDSSSFSSK